MSLDSQDAPLNKPSPLSLSWSTAKVSHSLIHLEIDDMIKEMRGMGLAELLTRMRECVGINHKVNEMVALVNDQYREIKELKAALRDRVETRAMDNHIRLMRA